MRPDPPTAAEIKVIRWFFGTLFCVAFVYIAWSWYLRSQQCVVDCQSQGFVGGQLKLNGGSRLNAGSHCVCEK